MQWSDFAPVPDLKLRLVAGLTAAGSPAIQGLYFRPGEVLGGERNDSYPLILEAVRQLKAYFERRLRDFDLPLDPRGTAFQLQVWNALTTIPYGETRSYLDIARIIGNPKAVRAVGAANGQNPISIIVPCHRVIGSGGSLVGYGGGLPLKKQLLELEHANSLPFEGQIAVH